MSMLKQLYEFVILLSSCFLVYRMEALNQSVNVSSQLHMESLGKISALFHIFRFKLGKASPGNMFKTCGCSKPGDMV